MAESSDTKDATELLNAAEAAAKAAASPEEQDGPTNLRIISADIALGQRPPKERALLVRTFAAVACTKATINKEPVSLGAAWQEYLSLHARMQAGEPAEAHIHAEKAAKDGDKYAHMSLSFTWRSMTRGFNRSTRLTLYRNFAGGMVLAHGLFIGAKWNRWGIKTEADPDYSLVDPGGEHSGWRRFDARDGAKWVRFVARTLRSDIPIGGDLPYTTWTELLNRPLTPGDYLTFGADHLP